MFRNTSRRIPLKLEVPFFLALIGITLFTSCTLKPKDTATLHIDITHLQQSIAQERKLVLNGNPEILAFPTPPNAPSPATPGSLAGFQCFGLNVMGPGIPAHDIEPGDDPPNVVFSKAVAGAPMAYLGINSTRITNTPGPQTVEISVPAGGARLIQLIGLVDNGDGQVNSYCAGSGGFPTGGAFWEVGRAFVANAFGDLAVSLTQDFSGNSQQAWHQEAKLMFGSGSCITYSGFYETGGAIASNVGVAFAIKLDPAPNPTALQINDILVEVAVTALTNLSSTIFSSASTLTGQTTVIPSSYTSAVATTGDQYFAAAGTYNVEFRYPPTNLTDPGASSHYLVIYSTDGVTQFQMKGRSTGSLPAPMVSAFEKATSGSAWGVVAGFTPYAMLARCY